MTDLKTQMPTGSDAIQRPVVQPAFNVDLLESALNSGDKPGIIVTVHSPTSLTLCLQGRPHRVFSESGFPDSRR